MANRIAGITVEIGGDTTKLEKALSGVNKEISSTQSALKDVDKLLKLDPKNVELLQQKQKLLQTAIEETSTKLKTLKSTSEDAAKSAKNYDAWKEKYDPIQKEIEETSEKLKKLKIEAQNADKDLASGKISQEKYDALQKEIEETETKLKDLREQAKQVSDEFGNPISPKQYDAIQREIIDTEQDLNSLTEEYKDFGSVAKQQAQIAAEEIKKVGENIKNAGEKMQEIGGTLSRYVTMPLVAAGTAGVTKFAEVDKTMQLANKTMGNTAEQADTISAAMKEAAANSIFGMSDAATATLNFARAGLDAEQAAAALAPAMNLAAGEGGNLDTVSAGLVATINGFHGSFEDAEHYADVFASACNNSALDVDSLSNAMSVAAPIFSSAGYAVEDAALYMGVLANNGIEADKAANSLKTGIARLVSPAKDGAEMMEQLGISVTNADGSMKDAVTIQQELHDAFAQLSESEQIAAASAIFGKNQMAPWLALINTAPADVDALNTSLQNCGNTTQEMADTMMGGFGGGIEQLKSSIDVLMTSFGEALAPTLQNVVDLLQNVTTWFNSLSSEEQQNIAQWALVAAAAGPVVTVLGHVTSGIGSIVSAGSGLISHLGNLGAKFGGMAEKAGGAVEKLTGLGSAASGAASPVSSAGTAVGSLSQNALGLVAAGAGIALAATGLALLAQSAIAIANAGPGAAAAMLGLVAALAGLAAGAAAIAAPLTAGAAGLVAFGAAVALVGTGILAATSGIALLATQLPTIAQYGSDAAAALAEIGAGLAVLSAGALAAAAAVSAMLLPFGGAALTIGATDLALVGLAGTLTLAAGGAGLLALAMGEVSASTKSIKADASAAGKALQDMVNSVDVISRALDGFKDLVGDAAKWFSELFKKETPSAESAARSMADKAMNAMKSSITSGGQSIQSAWKSSLNSLSTATSESFSKVSQSAQSSIRSMQNSVRSGAQNIASSWKSGLQSLPSATSSVMQRIASTIQSSLNSIRQKFANTRFSLNRNIALPHFSLTGDFDAETGEVPYVDVDWYKKAMDKARVLTSPTIFGAAGGRLLGGGEAGNEVVSGEAHLLTMIQGSVDTALGSRLDTVLGLMQQYLPGCAAVKVVVPVNSLDRALAQNTARRQSAW